MERFKSKFSDEKLTEYKSTYFRWVCVYLHPMNSLQQNNRSMSLKWKKKIWSQ